MSSTPGLPVTVTPMPAATVTPMPAATVTPMPAATVTPGPATTVTPMPAATVTPMPAATVTPGPATTVTPMPAATVTPGPAATVSVDFPNFGLMRQTLNSAAEIRVSAVDLSGLVQSGATSVLLATVHVLGVKAGTSDVSLQVIRMDDEDGFPMNPQPLSGAVNILNVAPVVDAGPDATILKRDNFVGPGSFIDPGADAWSATVNYGDGSGVQPLTLSGNAFGLSHVYSDAGSYTVTVTVTDGSVAVGSDTVQVQVTFVTLPGLSAPAQDLDGDGRAEDVNGNGQLASTERVGGEEGVYQIFRERDRCEKESGRVALRAAISGGRRSGNRPRRYGGHD